MSNLRKYQCLECGHQWILPFGPIMPGNCPKCGTIKILRVEEVEDERREVGRARSAIKGIGRKSLFKKKKNRQD